MSLSAATGIGGNWEVGTPTFAFSTKSNDIRSGISGVEKALAMALGFLRDRFGRFR